jgi:hypothetical protein
MVDSEEHADQNGAGEDRRVPGEISADALTKRLVYRYVIGAITGHLIDEAVDFRH